MVTISWGENTVHTFGGAAAPAPTTTAPTAFGSSAPSATTTAAPSGFAFGGSTTTTPAAPSGGLFGPAPATAPAPPSGSLFGSSPAPAPGSIFGGSTAPSPGGFFGSAPIPATGTGLFRSAPSPAAGGFFGSAPSLAGTGLFGAAAAPTSPAGGLFGTVPPAAPFGSTTPALQQQQPQQPQIPAQAALQAHMDASARQEEARVKVALEKIYQAYTGTEVASTTTEKSAHFSTILYNPISPELRQQQWAQGMGIDGQPRPIAPPRPLQISQKDWNQAVVRNPDFQNYMPAALVGAEALQARLTHQQEQANLCAKQLEVIQMTQESCRRRLKDVQLRLERVNRTHDSQRKKLINVMRKVELARCFNQPLQKDELEAMKKLTDLYVRVDRLRGTVVSLADKARTQPPARPVQVTDVPDDKQLMPVLKEHRDGLSKLTSTVKRDVRDLDLIQQRVTPFLALPGPPSSSLDDESSNRYY